MKIDLKIRKAIFVPVIIVLAALSLNSCKKNLSSDSLYTPTKVDVTSTATLADLQAGRSLFVAKCGACHQLYSPDSYSAASWKSIVPNMATRTNLSAAQISQVTKYVSRGK